MNDVEQAITSLRDAKITVEAQAYGFSLKHHELTNRDFAQCGFDNDSSISLSVNVDETPPVQWFFRKSYIEMAAFIVAAYRATSKSNPPRKDIIKSMRMLDKEYDDTDLNEITEQFLASQTGKR